MIKTAALYRVVDLISHEPGLEEIFLTFYGDGPGAEDEERS